MIFKKLGVRNLIFYSLIFKFQIRTVTVPMEESTVITELQTANGLVVAVAHTTSV